MNGAKFKFIFTCIILNRLIIFNLFYSSLSVILNSTAGVLLEDICRGCFKSKPSEKASNAIVKGSVLVLGVLSLVFILIVEKLGGILEVNQSHFDF